MAFSLSGTPLHTLYYVSRLGFSLGTFFFFFTLKLTCIGFRKQYLGGL